MFKAIPREIKEQILSRIKNEGVTANQVAIDAGISPKTVYGWLTKESIKAKVNVLEFSRLRRENVALYEIIGKLTAQIEKSKRGRL